MHDITRDNLLSVLACEFEKRPPAPAIAEVAPLATRIARTNGGVTAEFPESARTTVEAFAAAERQCCAGIGWEVEAGSAVTLRITANEEALDVIENMLTTIHIEHHQ